MAHTRFPETVDTRLALRVYAAVVGLCGFFLAAWGPMWFGAHLLELPWGRAAIIRMIGAVIMAVGVSAAGLATADQRTLRRMLSWFIGGHVVVWLMLEVQIAGPLGDHPLARQASWVMLTVILGLLYIRFPSAPAPRRAPSVLTVPERDYSKAASPGLYEQQIREAAAQEERNRLARDLHDAVKQQIFAIQTSAATAEARLAADPSGARDAVAEVRQSAREAMAEMAAMLEQLQVAPLGNTGLVEAIRKQCEALAFRTGADVDLEVGQLPEQDALEPGAHQAIFRIVQEALANVGRHARARHVRVSLETMPTRLEVRVEDDGLGFDRSTTPGGMGIQNMRARASEIGGSIEVGGEGGGTLVALSVPFETMDTRRYRRRRALALAVLLAAGTVLLLLNLFENGPALGNVSLVVFALLFMHHFRTWLRLRRGRGVLTTAPNEGAS